MLKSNIRLLFQVREVRVCPVATKYAISFDLDMNKFSCPNSDFVFDSILNHFVNLRAQIFKTSCAGFQPITYSCIKPPPPALAYSVSVELPWLESKMHTQLIAKLRSSKLNAAFGLRYPTPSRPFVLVPLWRTPLSPSLCGPNLPAVAPFWVFLPVFWGGFGIPTKYYGLIIRYND